MADVRRNSALWEAYRKSPQAAVICQVSSADGPSGLKVRGQHDGFRGAACQSSATDTSAGRLLSNSLCIARCAQGPVSAGFQLDDDRVPNNQIGDIFSNDNTIVIDSDALLLCDRKPSLTHFQRQSVLVDLFQKPRPERVQHTKCATDD